jgi:hypothetical protein
MKNLEQPRYIMSMAKNDRELDSIVGEIKSFLKEREAIAAITNERDLSNASQIHQINQQSRAVESNANVDAKLSLNEDERAAGYLRNEAAQESVEKDTNK